MSRSINVLCLSATALVVLLPTGVLAQQKSLKEQIQGPWSQASCNGRPLSSARILSMIAMNGSNFGFTGGFDRR
jgi:hypothetical protein